MNDILFKIVFGTDQSEPILIPLARDEVREMIEARRKAEHDEATRIESARLEGEARGEAKGKLESARKLIEHGMAPDEVAEVLGIKLEDIQL